MGLWELLAEHLAGASYCITRKVLWIQGALKVGSQTIRTRQIRLWSFGLLIWCFGVGVLGSWAWDQFLELIVKEVIMFVIS